MGDLILIGHYNHLFTHSLMPTTTEQFGQGGSIDNEEKSHQGKGNDPKGWIKQVFTVIRSRCAHVGIHQGGSITQQKGENRHAQKMMYPPQRTAIRRVVVVGGGVVLLVGIVLLVLVLEIMRQAKK